MTLAYFNNCTSMSATTIGIWFYNSSRVPGILMSVVPVHNKSFSQPVFKLLFSYQSLLVIYTRTHAKILQWFLEEPLAERRTRNIVSLLSCCMVSWRLKKVLDVSFIGSSDQSVGSLKRFYKYSRSWKPLAYVFFALTCKGEIVRISLILLYKCI